MKKHITIDLYINNTVRINVVAFVSFVYKDDKHKHHESNGPRNINIHTYIYSFQVDYYSNV